MIRPENEASQSLYKKLGFVKLYQTVRMTFTPSTWQDPENESSGYFRDNLENAVRQLTIEQKVVNAFQPVEIADEGEGGDAAVEGIVEEPEEDRNETPEEEGEEESEGRIEVTEVLDKVVEETAEEAEEATNEVEPEVNVDETANDGGGDQDDGGTDTVDAE